ncbi:mobile mystery protein A [Psychromonas sp. Urea-02u-13]|uniref:mobile mystery protein A n=1 Tax=Psychromonas sp. Urea-02u-13 TaxID=2058326 RepID=UPI000C34DB74|nr:mobile mystery protein A [Psychromonas sp. Urea-02u-13]PKG38947.1 transcriptional regulator [Psychromonas sp. Urea-02u-13]
MTNFSIKKPKNTVRSMVKEQYKEIVNSATNLKGIPPRPPEGWVRTIRKALDMSGAQLAKRLNLSRNRVSILERREIEGDITINQLKELADKLGCDFTYTLVLKQDVNLTLEARAEKLAKIRLSENSQNMFLEAQVISAQKEKFLIDELKQELLKSGGRVLWKHDKETVDN